MAGNNFKMANMTGQAENLKNLYPEKILIFSGKRKSGKDFITDELFKRLNSDTSVIVKLSGPIKTYWAKKNCLNEAELFGNSQYKEKYRLEMLKWSENIRNQNYGYFCKAAVEMYNAKDKRIWIVSDARRKTDLIWFKENYGDRCKTIRIFCTDEVRKGRGWEFCPGIDDSETECNLDDVEDWDLVIQNDGQSVELIIENLLSLTN